MNDVKYFVFGTLAGLILGLFLCDLRYSSQFKKGVVSCKGVYYSVEVHTDTTNLYEDIKAKQDQAE